MSFFDGVSDFGFGVSVPFVNNLNPAVLPGVGVSSGQQSSTIPAGTPWWQSVATLGLDGFKSWLNFDLAQQQVAKGQNPSQNATVGNLAAQTASSLSQWVPLLVIVLIVYGGYRLFFGRRK